MVQSTTCLEIMRLSVIYGALVAPAIILLSSVMSATTHDHLPAYAEQVTHHESPIIITNSMVMTWIVVLLIVVFVRLAICNPTLIPGKLQNFMEWLIESVYASLESILGVSLAKRTFWFFGGTFIFILISNWMGLIPGVGTIGWEYSGAGADPNDRFRPWLRGVNADLNMTIAMSFAFAVLWFYWAISENGLKGFLSHIFAPKAKFGPFLFIPMACIFLFVGVLELVSIAFRPVALSFRLYGNVFAGENILESMMVLVPIRWLQWLPALPFYFMELLVGLLQAFVFMLLTAVFLKLICEHADEH